MIQQKTKKSNEIFSNQRFAEIEQIVSFNWPTTHIRSRFRKSKHQ